MPSALLRSSHLILEKLRDATAKSIVTWKRAHDPSEFVGAARGFEFLIKFKYPAYNADEGSDNDYVEVHAFDHSHRFMVGTEGYHLALEVLAAGLPLHRQSYASWLEAASEDVAAMNAILRGRTPKKRRMPPPPTPAKRRSSMLKE